MMLLFPFCLVIVCFFFLGEGFLPSPVKRIGFISNSCRNREDPVKEVIYHLRSHSGDPEFLKQKWLEMAMSGRSLLAQADSTVTGADNLFFSLATFFTALDYLAVYLVGDVGMTTFSSVTFGELSEATQKDPLPLAWCEEFFRLKQVTIPVKYLNTTVNIRPSRIWAGIKHRGVVASQAVDIETFRVGEVEFSKFDILNFMDKGVDLIKSFPV